MNISEHTPTGTTKDRDIKPTEAPSREKVWQMFDRISGRYDLLNRLLSLRRDVAWRKRLARNLPEINDQLVLDLATGTGDVLKSVIQHSHRVKYGIGIDMAREMLARGREKFSSINSGVSTRLFPADAMFLPFKDKQFHTVSIAFGIRNVLDVKEGLREMYRVLDNHGRVLILEFSIPANRLIKRIYLFYFRYILPRVGGLISGDSYAYRYLNKTVETFPYGEAFCRLMQEVGFQDVRAIPLTFGIATLYRGDRLK
jgi:demethylmenaquinone methyltransferase/2-methoxy-6-polyprenyl-1,4-benzoquinol methylase